MMKRPWTAAILAGASILSATQVFADAPAQRVLVIPFTALNVPDSQQWISKGVMETIVADLGRTPGYVPIAFQGQVIVEDNATAVRLAKQASSSLVIRGATQVVGDTVRLTAQVIDVKSGDTIATASVTGPAADMLKLEDAVSAQLRGTAAPAGAAATTPASQPVIAAGPAPAPPAPQIIIISAPPAAQQGYPVYFDSGNYASYPTGYPGYYYGYYPALIGTVIVTNPRFDHGHDHDHDNDHDHFHGPMNTGGTPFVSPLAPNIPGRALVPNIPGNALVPNIHVGAPAPGFGAAPLQSSPRGTSMISQHTR